MTLIGWRIGEKIDIITIISYILNGLKITYPEYIYIYIYGRIEEKI